MSTRIPIDVAAVVRGVQDAERISALIIPADGGHDRFWTDSARLVLTAVLLHCHRRYGRAWGWPDLLALVEVITLAELSEAHPTIGQRMQSGRVIDSIMHHVVARTCAVCLHTVGAGKTMHGLRPSGAGNEG